MPDKSDSMLALDCVIVSKWVLSIIWKACYKLPKICFLCMFYRANEKAVKIWCFAPTSPFYNIFTNSLSSFIFFNDLKTYELIHL